MAEFDQLTHKTRFGARLLKRFTVFLILSSLLMTAGCKGCFESTEDKPKEKKKVKENFENQTPVTLPGFYPIDPEEKEKLEEEAKDDEKKRALLDRMDPAIRFNKTKLGHWVSVDFLAIANNFNADGYLETTNQQFGRPALINGTDYSVQTTRPVNLVKGDWKKLETSVFLPRRQGKANITTINYLLNNGGSLPAINQTHPHNLLEDYQFHMVLLSTRPDSLKYISFLDCIQLPKGEYSAGAEEPTFYSIVPSTPGQPIPLPGMSLNWTTISYLIWDDLDPDELSTAQKRALVDWLHFGGQIIFSGPDCIDRLQSSFLADYLPGQFEESITLNDPDLKELNKNWSIAASGDRPEKRRLVIREKSPLPAIRFKPHVDANFIDGCSGLALERRVGRGRVVATAFSINNRQISSWKSFASFFQNALLRKPNRKFSETSTLNVVTFKYDDDRTSIYDPLTGSTLRYISRDLAGNSAVADRIHSNDRRAEISNPTLADKAYAAGQGFDGDREDYILPGTGLSRNKEDFFHYGGFQSFRQSGVAGWNDDSAIASRARQMLKKSARITPPSASFVMKMLGLYLLVLVPINWLIFWLLGKVEWAWIAAPIIAITGAFMVVRYASLDIGFVRSVSHVGVLEMHGDFDRGHLSDYSALYTSLSTNYDVELDNLSGQSLPFANVPTNEFKLGETTRSVELSRTTSMEMKDFLVRSNSTGLLHTEMMLDVGGSFSFDGTESLSTVENGTLVNLQDAAVVKNNDGNLEFAWIGPLAAGDEAELSFKDLVHDSVSSIWNQSEMLVGSSSLAESVWKQLKLDSSERAAIEDLAGVAELQENWAELKKGIDSKLGSDATRVNQSVLAQALSETIDSSAYLAGVFNCVASNLRLGPGEVRLIGYTDQKLDQTKYQPAATQANQNLLVVVHLRHADLPECKRDKNAISDFIRGRSNVDVDEENESIIEENYIDGTE